MKIVVKRKSYWPLAVFTLLLVAVPIAATFLLDKLIPEAYVTKIILLCFHISLTLLLGYMTLTGRAYWINGGPSYEETVADPARAFLFLRRHLVRFAIGTLAFAVMEVPSFLLWGPWGFDVFAFCVTLIASAVSTVKVKF